MGMLRIEYGFPLDFTPAAVISKVQELVGSQSLLVCLVTWSLRTTQPMPICLQLAVPMPHALPMPIPCAPPTLAPVPCVLHISAPGWGVGGWLLCMAAPYGFMWVAGTGSTSCPAGIMPYFHIGSPSFVGM